MIVICNLCFRQKTQTTVLHLTNCRHVFCESCLFQINKKCFVCSKSFETIKIDSNMPEALRRFFCPFELELRKIRTIQRFQMEQTYYYLKRKADTIPHISPAEKKRQEIREKTKMIKQMIVQEQLLIARLTEFEKSLTPNLSKLMLKSQDCTLFDDSPEILRKRDDKRRSVTDSGFHRT